MRWPWSPKPAAPKMEIVGDTVVMAKPTEGTPYEREVKVTMAYLEYTRDWLIYVPVTTHKQKASRPIRIEHYNGRTDYMNEPVLIDRMLHQDLYDPRIFPTDGYMHAGDLGLPVSPQPVLRIGDGGDA